MVTWQFLQGAVLCGTHEHSFPNLCERAEGFFFTEVSFIFTKMQCHCYYFSSLLLSRPTFTSTLLKVNFPSLSFPYHPNTLGLLLAPSLSSLTGSSCGRSYYFKLLKLENFARVNHFAFLLLQLEASQNLPFRR